MIQEKGRAEWQDVPVPEIGPYDALVRPTAVATCTNDVHLIDSLSLPNARGKVIGPEAVGVVETVGYRVRGDTDLVDYNNGHIYDQVMAPERLPLLIADGKFDTAPLATHVLHRWDELADSPELMRSRDQSVGKPVVVID